MWGCSVRCLLGSPSVLQIICLDGGDVRSKVFPRLGKMAGHVTEKMVFCVGSDEDVNRWHL